MLIVLRLLLLLLLQFSAITKLILFIFMMFGLITITEKHFQINVKITFVI